MQKPARKQGLDGMIKDESEIPRFLLFLFRGWFSSTDRTIIWSTTNAWVRPTLPNPARQRGRALHKPARK